jgi:Tfp pilus assembly protein PilF
MVYECLALDNPLESKHYFMKAMVDVEKSLIIDPTNSVAILNRAFIQEKTGNIDAALYDYSVALAINPDK